MSIVWADGFDHYGADENVMLENGYSAVAGELRGISDSRTGTGCFACKSGSRNYARRSLDTLSDAVGVGAAMRFVSSIGRNSWDDYGIKFGNASGGDTNYVLYAVQPNANLGLSIYQGGSRVADSANNIITVGETYYWVEVLIKNNTANGGTGSIEVRLNGVVVVVYTGSITPQFSTVTLGNRSGAASASTTIYFDDFVIWDLAGTINNNFIGDHRCVTTYPNGDEIAQDWVPSSGSDGFDLIDETPPNDAGYIEASTPGDISEFTKTPVNVYTNSIAGVMIVSRALKTDAGVSTYRVGITSGAFTRNSPELSPGTTFGYNQYIAELDPNGDIPWTLSNFNAATLRLTRED